MRWILCGKGTAASNCLDLLIDRGDEVWAVGVLGDSGKDGWQRSFTAAARQRGVPFSQPRNINDSKSAAELSTFGANTLLSVQYDQILRTPLFRSVGAPCLNLHFSLLPRHRGVAPIAWALLDGDSETGVTLHHMVEDIDAGDIIAQRSVLTDPPDTTARELYDRITAAAAALFEDSYPFDQDLLSHRIPQDEALASYHRKEDFDFSKRQIDWARPANQLRAWLRAMIFPPFQYPETIIGGRPVAVSKIGPGLSGDMQAPPGEVVGIASKGIDVATSQGAIRICELIDPNEPGIDSETILSTVRRGDRLV